MSLDEGNILMSILFAGITCFAQCSVLITYQIATGMLIILTALVAVITWYACKRWWRLGPPAGQSQGQLQIVFVPMADSSWSPSNNESKHHQSETKVADDV